MNRYVTTRLAGRSVAGVNNPGVGSVIEVDEAAAALAVEKGELVPVETADVDFVVEGEEPEAAPVDYGSMRVAELRDLIVARGLRVPAGSLKADLVAALVASDG